jgi:hypothetical protein
VKWKVLFAGCLYLTSWERTLVRAEESKSDTSECGWPQSTVKDSQSCLVALGDPAQASGTAPASQQHNDASGFFHSWSQMAGRTQAEQPDWLSPIATTSGRLKQEFRYDVWRQTTPSGETGYTFGGGKGLEFIVAPRLQLMIGLPSYVVYTPTGPRDGFADTPLMLKFRLASGPPRRGNYLLTLLLGATVPTGSPTVGARTTVLSPGLAFGKGWGKFDVQSTLGVNLPTAHTTASGRQFLSNIAFQYRAGWQLWPEFEVNSTSFLTDKYRGETQSFLTPGLEFGRAHLWGHVHFAAGAGLQIAVTHFHTYNHRWILSVRFLF